MIFRHVDQFKPLITRIVLRHLSESSNFQTVFNRKCKGSLTEKDDSTTEIVIQGSYLIFERTGLFTI